MKRILALIPFTISTPLPSLLCLAIVLLTLSLAYGADEKTRRRATSPRAMHRSSRLKKNFLTLTKHQGFHFRSLAIGRS